MKPAMNLIKNKIKPMIDDIEITENGNVILHFDSQDNQYYLLYIYPTSGDCDLYVSVKNPE